MRFAQDDMIQGAQTANANFQYSGIRPNKLTSTHYTLVTVVTDISGSTHGFASELQQTVLAAIDACALSPMANNLLFRYVEFNSYGVQEKHGFLPLNTLTKADYKVPNCNGGTPLYDAMFSGIASINAYAKTLGDQDFDVNGITIVITDGEDNGSSLGPSDVKREKERGVTSEEIESVLGILVGVNAASYRTHLTQIKDASGFDQYVDAGNLDGKSLAKLADFISKSISSTSQALGTGGPSQTLTF